VQHTVIFGILVTILNNKKVTREYLSQKFEISMRTVARYLNVLLDVGIPIESIIGRNGGISLRDDYALAKGFLTTQERERLIACVKATAPTFDDNLNYLIIQKLEEAQKRTKQNKSLATHQTLYIDATGTYNDKFYKDKISIINRAIQDCTILQIAHLEKYGNTITDKFAPYCLVLTGGSWYLYSINHKIQDFVLLRLSKILNIVNTHEIFERQTVSIDQHMLARFEEPTINLCIEFSNLRLQDITEWIGQENISTDQLSYTAHAKVQGGSTLISKLLSFGSDIKVISPTWLRDEMMSECRRMMDYYSL